MTDSDDHAPSCAFCDSTNMNSVMDFGEVGLAGGFLKTEQFAAERTHPLRVSFCNDCYGFQVIDKVESNTLFNN